MKKKVTAPLSYDPGKGRPKEHLAYLNWQEMQQLRRLNGDNMERGPRGLPSFPPADAKGSSSKASSSSKPSGGGGRDTGAKGNVGMGKAPSSGKASSGSYGGGGRDTGGRGNVGAGKAPSSAKSPGYGGGGRDTGRAATKPSSAAKPAAAPSGVRSIPTVSRVPGARTPSESQISGAIARSASPAGFVPATPVSLSSQYDEGIYNRFSSQAPEVTSEYSKFDGKFTEPQFVDAAGTPFASWGYNSKGEKFDPNKLTPLTQKQYQAIVDTALRTRQPVQFFSGKASRSTGTPQHPSGQAMDLRLVEKFSGPKPKPLMGVTSPSPSGAKKVLGKDYMALDKPYRQFASDVYDTVYQNPDAYSGLKDGMRWGGNFKQGVAKDWMHFDTRVAGGLSADAQKFEKQAEKRAATSPSYVASYNAIRPTYTASSPQMAAIVPTSTEVQPSGFSRMSPAAQLALQGAVAAGKVLGSPSDYKIPSIKEASAFTKNMVPEAVKIGYMQGEAERFGRKIPSYVASGVSSVGRGIAGAISDRGSVQQASAEAPSEYSDAQFQPYGMTVEQEEKVKKTMKPAKTAIKVGAGLVGTVAPGAGLAGRPLAGAYEKNVEKRLNAYVAATPSERAAMEAKDPALIGWARTIGVQPQNDYSVYQAWAEKSGLRGPGETRGEDRAVQYAGGIGALPSASTPVGTSQPTQASSTSRPYQYYQWDVGVNIPSPGDPDYTNYQEYLRRRAQAQA